MLAFAMGAVVDGLPATFHTPLSGQDSPVRALVPIGNLFGRGSDWGVGLLRAADYQGLPGPQPSAEATTFAFNNEEPKSLL